MSDISKRTDQDQRRKAVVRAAGDDMLKSLRRCLDDLQGVLDSAAPGSADEKTALLAIASMASFLAGGTDPWARLQATVDTLDEIAQTSTDQDLRRVLWVLRAACKAHGTGDSDWLSGQERQARKWLERWWEKQGLGGRFEERHLRPGALRALLGSEPEVVVQGGCEHQLGGSGMALWAVRYRNDSERLAGGFLFELARLPQSELHDLIGTTAAEVRSEAWMRESLPPVRTAYAKLLEGTGQQDPLEALTLVKTGLRALGVYYKDVENKTAFLTR